MFEEMRQSLVSFMSKVFAAMFFLDIEPQEMGKVPRPRIGRRPDLHEVESQSGGFIRSRIRFEGPRSGMIRLILPAALAKLMAIGASTGWTEALKEVLMKIPLNIPGILVIQHNPAHFTTAFAQRLNQCCQIEVREAQDGDSVLNGQALIAPGNFHMRLRRNGGSSL